MATTYVTYMDSPVGKLTLRGTADRLTGIEFESESSRHSDDDAVHSEEPFQEVIRQLRSYFAGERTTFELPLDPHGTTFKRKTWDALLDIPYGETITYGELARRVGQPTASRAVGAANGKNPLPIVIPCHRVIGAGGLLTGYGGGLEIKQKLLAIERVLLP